MKRFLFLLALLTVSVPTLGACCCGPPLEPEDPVHAVRLGGIYYLLARDQPVPEEGSFELGPEHARVLRQIPCAGVVRKRSGGLEDPCGFQDGDSDVLPAGTALHPLDEVPAAQRLAAVVDRRLLTFHAYYPPD